MKEHSAAIFDLDGVIIDSGPLHMRAWKDTLEDRGIPFEDAEFRRHFGMRDSEVIPRLLGLIDDTLVNQVLQHKSQVFQSLVRKEGQPVEGLLEYVQHLQERSVRAAVASLATAEEIDVILEAVGLKNYLEVVITREHEMRDKPAPDIFLTAAYRMGVPVQSTAIFEDAISGVEAARSAGARTVVALTTSYSRGELSHADIVVDNFREPVLLELF